MAERSGVSYISTHALREALRERRSNDRRHVTQDELAESLSIAFINERRERKDRRAIRATH